MRKAVVCCTMRIRWIAKDEVEEHKQRQGFVPVTCYCHCEAFSRDSDLFDYPLHEDGEIGAIIVDQKLAGPESSIGRSFGRCIERIFVVEPKL